MQSTQRSVEVKKKIQKQGDPVDAEELTRRLTAHLAEQKLKANSNRNGEIDGARWDLDNKSDLHESGVSAPVLGGTSIKQDARRVIHKISEPLLKYQRQFENRFNGATRHKNPRKRSCSFSQHSMDSVVAFERDRDQWEHNVFLAKGADVEKNFYRTAKRDFNIRHLFLGSRAGCRNMKIQNQALITTDSGTSRNSNEIRHDKKNNANWLSQNRVDCRKMETSAQVLKKIEVNWVYEGKETPRKPSMNDISVGVTDISPSGSKPGFRETVVALFRKNTHT